MVKQDRGSCFRDEVLGICYLQNILQDRDEAKSLLNSLTSDVTQHNSFFYTLFLTII